MNILLFGTNIKVFENEDIPQKELSFYVCKHKESRDFFDIQFELTLGERASFCHIRHNDEEMIESRTETQIITTISKHLKIKVYYVKEGGLIEQYLMYLKHENGNTFLQIKKQEQIQVFIFPSGLWGSFGEDRHKQRQLTHHIFCIINETELPVFSPELKTKYYEENPKDTS